MTKLLVDKLTHNDIWTPDLDMDLPINYADIPNFYKWISWNKYSQDHRGFDFASYLSVDGKCVLGLPTETPIRTVANGIVMQISRGFGGGGYGTFINIEHGNKNSGLYSGYHHVKPLVKDGQPVKKGEIIATLYKDSGNEEGRLVHLHFVLSNGWSVEDRINVHPSDIFLNVDKYIAKPQGSSDFQIKDLKRQPEIHQANFKKLRIGD